MAVCKIIGWNEGNRTESACDRQPQMPDATRSFSRSARQLYARPAWWGSPHLPNPAHRKSLPRRQLSTASTSDWLQSQYNRFAILSNAIALSGLSTVAPLEIAESVRREEVSDFKIGFSNRSNSCIFQVSTSERIWYWWQVKINARFNMVILKSQFKRNICN